MTDISIKINEEAGQKRGNLDKLKENWPLPFVKRKDIEKFSCGLINQHTIASLDSLKKGIKNRFRIGHEVAYSAESVIDWLKARLEE